MSRSEQIPIEHTVGVEPDACGQDRGATNKYGGVYSSASEGSTDIGQKRVWSYPQHLHSRHMKTRLLGGDVHMVERTINASIERSATNRASDMCGIATCSHRGKAYYAG